MSWRKRLAAPAFFDKLTTPRFARSGASQTVDKTKSTVFFS